MPTTRFETAINTNLVFLHQTGIRSKLIYGVTLLAIVLTLGALPFIYTAISIKSIGLMQSEVEKTELLAPVSGRLLYVNLSDNQKVTKGSTLLIIDGTLPQNQKDLLTNQARKLMQQLKDAECLIKRINESPRKESPMPKTRLYTASWLQYVVQSQNATNTIQQVERTYQRYRTLYTKNAVTLAELELYKFNFEQALSDQQILNKKYINQWQLEANQYHNELRDLQSQQIQLNEQIKQYRLKATLNGSIQNLTGLQKGTYVYANQKLCEISPDNALFAYLYVRA